MKWVKSNLFGRSRRTLALFGVFLGMVALYSNCSPAQFNTEKPAAGNESPVDRNNIEGTGPAPGSRHPAIEDVKKACGSSPMKSKIVQADFGNPRNAANVRETCNWNRDGNLGERNGYFQARIEQDVEFDLPAGAKICDMEFSVPEVNMRYDDHIFLAFDDVLLAASYPVDDRLPESDGMLTYGWNSLVGTTWPKGNFPFVYCLGKDEGFSQCSWPETEKQGRMSMQFNPILFKGISARNLNRSRHQLKFITTGDDDPNSDCQHEPLAFTVNVRYVE